MNIDSEPFILTDEKYCRWLVNAMLIANIRKVWGKRRDAFFKEDFKKCFGLKAADLLTEEQHARVVEEADKEADIQTKIMNVVCNEVKKSIFEGEDKETAFENFISSLPKMGDKTKQQFKNNFMLFWDESEPTIKTRRQIEKAQQIAEEKQLAQLERVERHRLKRIEEERKASEALQIAEERERQRRKAKAAEREAEIQAKREAAEARRQAKEEAKRQAWAKAHPQRMRGATS